MTITPSAGGNKQVLLMLGIIAVVLIALGVGVAGGMLLGQKNTVAPVATAAAAPGVAPVAQGPGVPCQFELPPADQWVLAGMICNCDDAGCNGTPLGTCHCDTAHAMKEVAKRMIGEGAGPEEIGVELERVWGPGIVPVGSN